MSEWDVYWKAIDEEFENELTLKKGLLFISFFFFFVWEGNHYTIAWMELISDKHKDNKAWHLLIYSAIIDPTKNSELALLGRFLCLNE